MWAVEAQAEIASPGLSLAFVGGFRLCAFDVEVALAYLAGKWNGVFAIGYGFLAASTLGGGCRRGRRGRGRRRRRRGGRDNGRGSLWKRRGGRRDRLAAGAAPDDGPGIWFAVCKLRASMVNPEVASAAEVGVDTHSGAADATWVLGGIWITFDPRSEE